MLLSDEDKELINLMRAGQLDEFKKRTKSESSTGVLRASLPIALARCDAAAVKYIIGNFSHDNGVPGSNFKPFLFTDSHRVANSGGRWALQGDGPWAGLFKSGKTMKDPQFAACARYLLAEESFSNSLPLSITEGELANGTPLSQAAHNGDLELVKGLLESGVFVNGYNPAAEGKYYSTKPKVSPLGAALRQGRGDVALALLAAGANPSQDGKTRCRGAAMTFINRAAEAKGDDEGVDQARLAFRVALRCDGWESSAKGFLEPDWNKADPLDSVAALEVWLAGQALETERLGRAEEAPERKPAAPAAQPEKKLSWFGRLTRRSPPSESPAPAAEEPKAKPPARRREAAALAALLEGKPRDFAREAGYLTQEERSALLFQSWAMAKSAFWRMPLPGGVGEQGREPALWGCFKAAVAGMEPAELDAAHPQLGGMSLMALASALGHSDVCAALVERGASVDPDPLIEGAAPLALAIRFGHSDLALSLLDAGADPLEGFKLGAFEPPRRGWAVHEALKAQEERVLARLLEAEPRCAGLKNANGEDALSACDRALAKASEEGKERLLSARALCEAALIRAQPERAPSPEGSSRPHRGI